MRRDMLACVALGLAQASVLASPEAVSIECGTENVTVTAPARVEAEQACDAVRRAVAFLDANGLQCDRLVHVKLVTELPADRAREGMLACYSHLDDAVHVLTLSSCQGVEDPFGLKTDPVLYQGVIAHEVAHAVAACNFAVAQPSSVAQEYIAYVTQLATLPADRRKDILSRFPGGDFRPDAASNAMLLRVDPGRFAARAYRHFVQPENGAAFLRRVISGGALTRDVDVTR